MTYNPDDPNEHANPPAPLAVSATLDTTTDLSLTDIQRCARMFLASGLFPVKNGPPDMQLAQLAVKIMAGQELGIAPFAAARGIDVINGQIAPDAGLTAALVNRSGLYRYSVEVWNAERCDLEWFCRAAPGTLTLNGGWAAIGASSFTIEEAKQAGLLSNPAWSKYPKAMLFARALTQGARAYCPDIFLGAVYSPEELGNITAPVSSTPTWESAGGHVIANPNLAGPPEPYKPPTVSRETPYPGTSDFPAAAPSSTPDTVAELANTVGVDEEATAFVQEVVGAIKPLHWTPLVDACATAEDCDALALRIELDEDHEFRKKGALARLAKRRAAMVAQAVAPAKAGTWTDPRTGEVHNETENTRTAFYAESLAQCEDRDSLNAMLAACKEEVTHAPAQWRYLFSVYTKRLKEVAPPVKKPAKKKPAAERTYGEN
jgi:hypothetical protein